jgi:GNAT superfamily N-acetyltransferase
MIKYRKATVNDIDDLLKVRIDFLHNAKNIRNEDDEKILIKTNREFLLKSLSDGSYIQWLAIDETKIVGTSSVSIYLLPPNSMRVSGKVAYIGNTFTCLDYRKQGIARGMITHTEKWAQENGYHQIRAWSSEDKIEAVPMWFALDYCMCPAKIWVEWCKEIVDGFYVAKKL